MDHVNDEEAPGVTADENTESEDEQKGKTGPSGDGGLRARRGFKYQDLCAFRYVVDAAIQGTWHELHCESEEDITLVRQDAGVTVFKRFVQVKYKEKASTHWSCTSICAVETASVGRSSSIVAKLFTKDLTTINYDFRLVTNEWVAKNLETSSYRWRHPEPNTTQLAKIFTLIEKNLDGWTHPDGIDLNNLVSRFAVEQHCDTIENFLVLTHGELEKMLRSQGVYLLPDEVESVFKPLYYEVVRAATADREMYVDAHVVSVGKIRSMALDEAVRRQSTSTLDAASPPLQNIENQLSQIGCTSEQINIYKRSYTEYNLLQRQARSTQRGREIEEIYRSVAAIIDEEVMDFTLNDDPKTRLDLFRTVYSRLKTLADEQRVKDLALNAHYLFGMSMLLLCRGHWSLKA